MGGERRTGPPGSASHRAGPGAPPRHRGSIRFHGNASASVDDGAVRYIGCTSVLAGARLEARPPEPEERP